MAKNLISEVCKILGVNVGEEFKIKSDIIDYPCKYYIDEDGELRRTPDSDVIIHKNIGLNIIDLLSGCAEIVKLSWQPKEGEKYYTLDIYSNYKNLYVCKYSWHGHVVDYALLKSGWVYRTAEEAKAALPKVAEELGGKV